MNQEVEIFLSYAREDGKLARELLDRLIVLEQQNPPAHIWSEDKILPGQVWERAVREHLERAQIILLLLSPAFFASNHLMNEFSLIMEKSKAGTAVIIPIILRATDLSQSPLSELESLPAKGKPLSKWISRDLAYQEIVDKIKETIGTLNPPAKVDSEENRLRDILETFSAQELLTLSVDLRLNIGVLLEDIPERSVERLPKISVDRLLQYMGKQGRIKELADYIHKNHAIVNRDMENV